MRRALALAAFLAAVLAAGIFWATRPVALPAERFAGLKGDAIAGERLFWAAGCSSCHAAPAGTGAEPPDPLLLSGGRRFATQFGTFVAPNVSNGPAGIGDWTLAQFATALKRGVSPEGRHYYPAFPYTTYTRMTDADVADLWAFWRSLPADDTPSAAHEVGFPFSIRAGLGAWKALHLREDWIAPEHEGRYLVEALGHCGECHTPRDATGGLDLSRWLAGAPLPVGEGRVPGLTPEELDWSEADIAYYLETGFTPDFDSAGGEMAEVIRNTARLSAADREAIAGYLKALP